MTKKKIIAMVAAAHRPIANHASNTASHNSNDEYFKPLRWGVDSLYLSYPGALSAEVEARLKGLKQLAQDPDPSQQSQAQYSDARLPDKDRLFSMGLHTLLTFMASEGITDLYRGQEAFIRALYAYHEEKAHQLGLPFDTYTAQKLALKNREFNTVLNNPELEEERKALEKKRAADAYRKAADGE